MKSAIAVFVAAVLTLSPQVQDVGSVSQDADKVKIRQLEAQMARYREATDKLIATLTRANDELNDRAKIMSRDRAEMAIRIAKLEVLAEKKSSSRTRRGLVYRGNYKKSVDNLNRSIAAMMRADSIDEAHKLLAGAALEIEAARRALPIRRD